MLESSVLPKFQLILNRKSIFPFQNMHLALIPHMWVPWGTNWRDILDPQAVPLPFWLGLSFTDLLTDLSKLSQTCSTVEDHLVILVI